MSYSKHWILAVSGTLLVCLAIINVMQRRPRNRFAWSYSLNRAITGIILAVAGAGIRNVMYEKELYWV